jgi:hypothetical protein
VLSQVLLRCVAAKSVLESVHDRITASCRYIAAAFCDTVQRAVKAAGFYLGAQLKRPSRPPSPPAPPDSPRQYTLVGSRMRIWCAIINQDLKSETLSETLSESEIYFKDYACLKRPRNSAITAPRMMLLFFFHLLSTCLSIYRLSSSWRVRF